MADIYVQHMYLDTCTHVLNIYIFRYGIKTFSQWGLELLPASQAWSSSFSAWCLLFSSETFFFLHMLYFWGII